MKELNFKSAYFDSTIRLKGFFDIQASLRFIKKWMEARNYTYYERQFNKKPDIKGFRYKIKIEADKRINAYVRWYLYIEIKGLDIEQKETIIDGKKQIKDYGRIKFTFNAKLVKDSDKRWETAFLKKLENFFLSNVVKWENDMVWTDELYYDMYQLKEDFSRYQNMYYIG